MAGWLSAAAGAAASPSPGCASPPTRSGDFQLPHHGLTRAYRLHVPAGRSGDHPLPLVVVFHGWGGDEREFLNDPAVIQQADAHGYLVVAPRGLGSGTPDGRKNSWTFSGSATGIEGPSQRGASAAAKRTGAICDTRLTQDYRYPSCATGLARNSCSWTQCQDDDVDFTIALVKHVSKTACVDSSRIFAAGGSNGGMFAWELGQNPKSAPLFRAIAPLIGLPHRGYLAGPARKSGIPVLLITGMNDPTVPPGAWEDDSSTTTSNGSDRFYYTGATAIIRRWSAAAGCDVSRAAARIDTGVAQTECRSYCPGRWPAVMDCRAPMGHEYQFDWSWKLILDFFDRS